MNFLQPLVLIALPLMLLPVIIHLINQQRHRTVPWAAMMFLMTAKRMSKGMARIRHIFILLMRTLAIAALIFAISRPLSGGWLGSIGLAKPDVTMVLPRSLCKYGDTGLTSGGIETLHRTQKTHTIARTGGLRNTPDSHR